MWFPLEETPRQAKSNAWFPYLDVLAAGRGSGTGGPAQTFATTSVLNSGTWYKIAVTEDGIYKLDRNFFTNMGLNPAGINPQNIRIYGNGGGMLPFDNGVVRHDDLQENAIYVEGEADGVFDNKTTCCFSARARISGKPPRTATTT